MANRLPSDFRPSSSGFPSSSAVLVWPRRSSAARIAGYQSPNTNSAAGPGTAAMSTSSLTLSNIVAVCRKQAFRSARCRLRCCWLPCGSRSTPASPCSAPRCWTTPTPCTPRSRARCCCATTGSRSTPTASGIWRKRRCSTGRWPRACAGCRCWATAPRRPGGRRAHSARAHRARAGLRGGGVRPPGILATRTRAGLYAALILLSSPGIFLFTRILLPDAMLCLWLTLAMLCFWLTEQAQTAQRLVILSGARSAESKDPRLLCYAFAACCALGVLTKGLIGVVFPIAIVALYLLLTRGLRGAVRRMLELHPFSSALVFLALAAPWHLLTALANPTRGRPGRARLRGRALVRPTAHRRQRPRLGVVLLRQRAGAALPEPARAPRLRHRPALALLGAVPVWLMPWSAFVFNAIARAVPLRCALRTVAARTLSQRGRALQTARLGCSSRCVLLLSTRPSTTAAGLGCRCRCCSSRFSTRQEYYVLPALPPLAILIAGWLRTGLCPHWAARHGSRSANHAAPICAAPPCCSPSARSSPRPRSTSCCTRARPRRTPTWPRCCNRTPATTR